MVHEADRRFSNTSLLIRGSGVILRDVLVERGLLSILNDATDCGMLPQDLQSLPAPQRVQRIESAGIGGKGQGFEALGWEQSAPISRHLSAILRTSILMASVS